MVRKVYVALLFTMLAALQGCWWRRRRVVIIDRRFVSTEQTTAAQAD